MSRPVEIPIGRWALWTIALSVKSDCEGAFLVMPGRTPIHVTDRQLFAIHQATRRALEMRGFDFHNGIPLGKDGDAW